MKSASVKKIIIELNGKDVELTMAQARELHSALSEIFGERVREVITPIYPRPYRWPWYQPSWICSSGTKATLSGSSMRLSVRS